jgi:cytosine/adenosine deaminase-related metal-dependent hydrolase
MGLGDELGQIKEGYPADLLLVDGDPMKDLHLRLSPLCSRTTPLPHRPSRTGSTFAFLVSTT